MVIIRLPIVDDNQMVMYHGDSFHGFLGTTTSTTISNSISTTINTTISRTTSRL